jgi:hypothetical protein
MCRQKTLLAQKIHSKGSANRSSCWLGLRKTVGHGYNSELLVGFFAVLATLMQFTKTVSLISIAKSLVSKILMFKFE